MTTNYNIIACDGGGIRGLLTAILLNDLETNPPQGYSAGVLSNVSLFAGTSTGSGIAIGLASGAQPSALVTLYETQCGTIFQPYNSSGSTSPALARLQLKLPQPSFDLCGLLPTGFCYVEYTNAGLYQALYNFLSQQTNPDEALTSLSTGVLVTTFRMGDSNTDAWSPLALTNLPNAQYGGVSLIDAAMSSGAAPIYFPPHQVTLSNGVTMWCADGGLFANNPSAYALANILGSQVLEQQNQSLSKVRLLSIGTGITVDAVPPGFLSDPFIWGTLSWLNPLSLPPEPPYPLLAAMFDAQSQIADFETSSILGSSQYQRANPTLTQTIALDDCSAIPVLETTANDYIATQEWIDKKQWAYENFI